MSRAPETFEVEFLDSIIENIPDMIFLKDAKDLRFVLFNRAGEKLLGYSRDELLGKNDYDFFPRKEAEFFTAKDREVLEGRMLVDIPEEPIHTRYKGTRVLHTKKIPILDDRGEPLYLLGIAEDITHRKELEIEKRRSSELDKAKGAAEKLAVHLRRSEAHLTRVIEGVPDALFVIDGRGIVVDVNSAAVGVSGVSQRSELLRPIEELLSRISQRGTETNGTPTWDQVKAWNSNEHHTRKGTLRKPIGSNVEIIMRAVPLGAQEKDSATLLVIRDVTEQRHLESLRDQFLLVAAHEFKTPLATIQGYSEIMMGWSLEELKTMGGKALEVIHRQCGRLNRLVQEMLEVSRLQLDRFELHKQSIQLDDLVPTVVAEMQATTQKHKLSITRSEPSRVDVDADRIEQVLANLLGNAIQFSPEGGDVQVSLSRRGAEALVEVRDFGLGIPEGRQHRVFERYFQAHKGTEHEMTSGLGMGLFIAKELVTRHGGEINFQSEEGKGSTFHFSLPLQLDEIETKGMKDRALVLIVDDDADLLDLTSLALEKEGYRVQKAYNGREALELIAKEMPDIILLDMRMPIMDGWRFAREFRSRHGKAAPILVITAATDARRHAREIGAEGFVSKPFGVTRLLKMIEALREGSRLVTK